MNRKQRRALERATKKGKLPASMTKAAQSVQKAVAKLDKVGDLDETLGELRTVMADTQQSLAAVLGEYQLVAEELATQREINIRLLTILLGSAVQRNLSEWSDEDLARVRALEGSLRESYTTTATQDDSGR